MKKVIAAFCAISAAIGGLSILPVNAEDAERSHFYDYFTIFELAEGDNGSAIVSTTSPAHYSFIVVTDSTKDFKTNTFSKNILSVGQIPTSNDDFLSTWDDASAKTLSKYGSDVKYYSVSVKSTGNMEEDLPLEARRFMLKYSEIKDIYFYNISSTTNEGYWDGEFTIWNRRDTTQEQRESFVATYELNEEETFQKIKQDYLTQKSKCKELLEERNLTEEEKQILRKSYGLPTDYELLKPIFDFARHLEETYPDVVAVANPEIEWNRGETGFSVTENHSNAVSAWESVGDINSDGVVNAKDATNIFSIAAKVGTNPDYNSNNNLNADINADGKVNAVDGTLALRFSASKGTGVFSGSLGEFVKDNS